MILYVAQDGLEVLILMPLPRVQDLKCILPYPVYVVLGTEPGALCLPTERHLPLHPLISLYFTC